MHFLKVFKFCVCVCVLDVWAHSCHIVHEEDKGQLRGVAGALTQVFRLGGKHV